MGFRPPVPVSKWIYTHSYVDLLHIPYIYIYNSPTNLCTYIYIIKIYVYIYIYKYLYILYYHIYIYIYDYLCTIQHSFTDHFPLPGRCGVAFHEALQQAHAADDGGGIPPSIHSGKASYFMMGCACI